MEITVGVIKSTLKMSAGPFVKVLIAFKRKYRRQLFWAACKDIMTGSFSMPHRVKLSDHQEMLDLFEKAIPAPSLRWAAAHIDVESWQGLYAGDDLKKDLCISTRASKAEQIRLLAAGQEAFDVRMHLIKHAKQSVLVQYSYIYLDTYGWLFCEALAKAAMLGLNVEVMVDEFGAAAFAFAGENPLYPCRKSKENQNIATSWNDMMQMMVKAGVKVTYWCGVSSPKLEFSRKNHTKSLIIDDRYAILGDRNIGAEYVAGWDGVDILLVGDAAAALTQSFYQDMSPFCSSPFANGDLNKSSTNTQTSMTPAAGLPSQIDGALANLDAKDIDVEILVHIPRHHGYDLILHRLARAIRCASKSVDIRSCYMALAAFLQRDLIAALERGVRVRLITNSLLTNDLKLIQAALCQSLIEPVKAGAKLYMTKKSMDHTKLMVIDQQWICIGSWNCWLRSHFYEAETSVIIEDAGLGKNLVQNEFDGFTAAARIESGEISAYSAADLADEAQASIMQVGATDALHAKLSLNMLESVKDVLRLKCKVCDESDV